MLCLIWLTVLWVFVRLWRGQLWVDIYVHLSNASSTIEAFLTGKFLLRKADVVYLVDIRYSQILGKRYTCSRFFTMCAHWEKSLEKPCRDDLYFLAIQRSDAKRLCQRTWRILCPLLLGSRLMIGLQTIICYQKYWRCSPTARNATKTIRVGFIVLVRLGLWNLS